MRAPRPKSGAVAFPRAPLLIPANLVHVALVAENAAENEVMFDALDLEAPFGQVATGLDLGVLSHAATASLEGSEPRAEGRCLQRFQWVASQMLACSRSATQRPWAQGRQPA
jgi:hypothetical protein